MILKHSIVVIILLSTATICSGFTAVKEIPVPENYQRISYPEDSFGYFLQHLPLKDNNTIRKYNGKKVLGFLYNVYAVIDMPLLFQSDLEQCADFCMRFWAEFHKSLDILDKLFLYDYSGSKKYFKESNKSFKKYLNWHMAYSNSYSLKKGADKIENNVLNPGDMFVQNTDGGIGHVSMIIDAAENKDGQRIFLIGYGFIPAQEFHIEKAKKGYGINGWFTKDGYIKYLSEFPFGRYGTPELRRFY